ncbi:MAG: peptidoglycan binding domain-containing protein [Chloroflexota bacterium]|nr:peptidoglycan binding domain-containing protein [Chloroflexota bacterium]
MTIPVTLTTDPGTDRRGLSQPSRETLRRLARGARVAMFVVATGMAALIAGLALYGVAHADRTYEGVRLAGVPVGGMTRAEVAAMLEGRLADYTAAPLVFEADGQRFEVRPEAVGVDVDAAAAAEAALGYGRQGSWWNRSREWVRALLSGADVQPDVSVNETSLREAFAGMAPGIVRAAEDATVDMAAAGGPTVLPERHGVALDVTASRARLLARLRALDPAPVALVLVDVRPGITATQLVASVPNARAAVAGAFTLRAVEGTWTLDEARLREVVSVDPGSGAVVADERAVAELVAEAATAIDRPAVDAGVTVAGDGALVVVPGVPSAMVDRTVTVAGVMSALVAGVRTVEASVSRADPAITDGEAEAGRAEAEALVGSGIELTWDGGGTEVGRGDLVRALTITARPAEADPFLFGLDTDVMIEMLGTVATGIDDPAEDVRLRYLDGQITVVSQASEGRLVDRSASLDDLVSAIFDGEPSVGLTVEKDTPDFTAKDRTSIEVPDLLGESSTYYADSSDPRRQNVERGVELENGWMVPPGGTFSFVENVGKIDEKNGFVTGFGIVADEERGGVTTAPVIGGGICQVSTTIFQAAFWAGMPVTERYQHPYWIRTYGEEPFGMRGLDAMINVEDDWALDLKFKNTTDDWMAVEIYADGERVYTRLLGTNPQWDVEVDGPDVTNVIDESSTVTYTDSPELEKGAERQVEFAQEGFDVKITREVRDAEGETIDTFTLESSYAASRNTVLRGTG